MMSETQRGRPQIGSDTESQPNFDQSNTLATIKLHYKAIFQLKKILETWSLAFLT